MMGSLVKPVNRTINYVQDTYAHKNNLSTAKICNKAGRYVEPSLAEANKTIARIKFNFDFTVNISDPHAGYPRYYMIVTLQR